MAATAQSSVSVLRQIEEQYNKLIDEHVDKLVDSFSDIVKVAQVTRDGKGGGGTILNPRLTRFFLLFGYLRS